MYFILYASSGCTVHLAQVRFSWGGNVEGEVMSSRPAEDRLHSRHMYESFEIYTCHLPYFTYTHAVQTRVLSTPTTALQSK